MRTIYTSRDLIRSNYGKRAIIKVIGLRNKTEIYEGIISECYNNVFILLTKNGKKSFTYTDVLIGNIKVNVK
ncbi:MAG TPA: hypothetical protein DCE23_03300 [Firmicutes bacterium]|nr:hypothetical protein [Bacillota bacterium]